MIDFRRRWLPLLFCLLALAGCTGLRVLRYNAPSTGDYAIFARRYVARGPESRPLPSQPRFQMPPVEAWAFGKHYTEGMGLDEFLINTNTTALLVLQDDSLAFEWYTPGRDSSSIFTTFSLAKVILNSLAGIAIERGQIDSLDQAVAHFLPKLKGDTNLEAITIRHLLQMTSGIKSNEGFAPWSRASRLYYSRDIASVTERLKSKAPPGTDFHYSNLSSQLLGEVLVAATGKSLSEQLSEQVWAPMGAEADAFWSLDEEDGMEKAFCCINGRARDFARFGMLWMHEGRWDDRQVIPTDWVYLSTRLDTADRSPQRYQLHWYTSAEEVDFYGEGLLGQFIYVSPKTRTVIVRFGEGLKYKTPWYDMFRFISGTSTMPRPIPIDPTIVQHYEGTWEFGDHNLGDTTLAGKTARLIPKQDELKVKTRWNRNFRMVPSSDSTFFNLDRAREFVFRQDSIGDTVMVWKRRGNEWELRKVNQ